MRTGTKGVPRLDREAQIVAVACRRFGEQGYAGTSVADVALAAGISKPLIYQYFGSKDGLYVVALREAAAVLVAEIERTAALGAVGIERAVLTLDGMFRVLEPQPWLWRLVFDPSAPRTGEVAEVLAEHEERLVVLGTDGVRDLLELVGNDDPDDLSALRAVWENAFRTLVGWWLDHPGTTPEEMTARCERLLATLFGGS
ncbi:TetR/AcrR family transcriptional regulator [Nocardioides litoris]|uniref:TetR/AcrR family transcriptional regulator n=1 Tax=Nocardioides litoris TaxID=1926648 RepID=UPI00111CCA45|nr:TetR/AcrR family transcriptional regulator [Nocardioides litoris]